MNAMTSFVQAAHLMPRPRWPHLHREVSRHGTIRWVVRIGHGPRIPLTEPYGSREFEAQYHAAVRSDRTPKPAGQYHAAVRGDNAPKLDAVLRARKGTLKWLWDQYRELSPQWSAFRPGTRYQRERLMLRTLAECGEMPLCDLTRKMVVAGRDRRKKAPSQASNWIVAMRGMFQWAVEAGHVDEDQDPTRGVKALKLLRKGGWRPTTEDEIEAVRTRWAPGTRERLAFEIALNTGLRRGDVVRLGPGHVKNGWITLTTEKTATPVRIPVNAALAAEFARHAPKGSTWVAKSNSEPFLKSSFGEWFHEFCLDAGVDTSPHCLRKAACARLIDDGLTDAELEQIMGWAPGSRMTRIYTRRRDANALAEHAAAKMAGGGKRTESRPYSQPFHKVGMTKRNLARVTRLRGAVRRGPSPSRSP
jgi:integrase